MFQWVTVELAGIESIPEVAESPEVSSTCVPTSTNSKRPLPNLSSHPGWAGKCGIRHFHMQRNTKYTPTVNTDKLWSLVSTQTRLNAEKSKDKAAVIDVTKSVNFIITYRRASSRFLERACYPRFLSLSRQKSSARSQRSALKKQEVHAFLQREKDL